MTRVSADLPTVTGNSGTCCSHWAVVSELESRLSSLSEITLLSLHVIPRIRRVLKVLLFAIQGAPQGCRYETRSSSRLSMRYIAAYQRCPGNPTAGNYHCADYPTCRSGADARAQAILLRSTRWCQPTRRRTCLPATGSFVIFKSDLSPRAQANLQQSYVLSNGNSTIFIGDDPAELVKRDGTKYVFMHHIVGNTYPYTQADWADDIRQIQAKGVDAIALNIGSSDWQRGQIASAYAAAVGSPLKLFISFDFTEMPCDVADVVSRTNQWANHPNQFKVNGKTMISSFSGDCFGNSGWQSIKDQTSGYLMPFIPNLEGKFSSWPSLDSWLCWGCAWPQGDYTKNTDDDNYYISQLGTRYSATISPWFYTHYSYKNIVYNSDNWLLVTRWEQLMSFRNTITFAELVSWNDYGESHHMGPVKGAMPSGTNWVNGLPHTAWFDMSQYYITAFQTGTYPPITKDVIYFWARTHPVAATASSDSLGKPSGWDWVEDTLWAVVFSTSPGSVTLTSGTNTQTFSVNAGVNKLKLPLSPGKITVSMTKNGQVTINYSPAGYTFITNPVTYNYNAYVDSASAVVTPPSSTSSSASSTAASTSTSSATPTSTGLSYAFLGCYVDPGDARVLNGGMTSSSSQTVAGCASSCAAQGYAYFGTEYGIECWCGSSIRAGAASAPSSDCSTPCSGKSSDICGNNNRISLYKAGASPSSSTSSSATPTSPSSTSATPTSTSLSYAPLGCYNDPGDARVLNGGMTSSSSQTVAGCASSCAAQGFAYFGTEYGNECWCGSAIRAGASTAPSTDCSTPCSGKSSDICGNGNRLSLYRFGASPSSSATSSPTPTSSSSTSSAAPTSTSLSYSSLGCYNDPGDARVLNGGMTSSSSQTIASCAASCAAQGSTYFGTEYGNECWCGSSIRSGATVASSGDCSMPCAGKASDICGNSYKLSLYRLGSSTSSTAPTSSPTPTSSTITSSPVSSSPRPSSSATPASSASPTPSFAYAGCYVDSSNARILNGGSTTSSTLSVSSCISSCSARGFVYAGTEYGKECWCGSVLASGATRAAESDCKMTCSGQASDICGGSNRMSLYRLSSGTSSSSSVPTSSATSTSQASTSSTSSTTTSASSTPSTTWTYVGCVAEGTTGSRRALTGPSYTRSDMTPALCQSLCTGYDYSGTENGSQCFCGNSLTNNGATGTTISSTSCNTACSGDSTQKCGGSWTLSLYTRRSPTQPRRRHGASWRRKIFNQTN